MIYQCPEQYLITDKDKKINSLNERFFIQNEIRRFCGFS
mgnify:CR=1 FL=1